MGLWGPGQLDVRSALSDGRDENRMEDSASRLREVFSLRSARVSYFFGIIHWPLGYLSYLGGAPGSSYLGCLIL